MDAPPPADESATTAITNHMICLAREGGAEHICFLLALRASETYSLPKTFKDVTKLQADSKKRWLESCLEELKSLKDRDVYEIVDLLREEKRSRTAGCSTSSLMVVIDLVLLPKDFLKLKVSTLMNYSLQLSTMRLRDCFLLLLHLRIQISKALTSKQPTYMVIWMRKSIQSSQRVSNYLGKKIKSGDFAKHCIALSKPAYPGGAQ